MNIQKLEKRNCSMDIIRIVAAFTVLSVHFFLHNGFYSQTVEGSEMYIMVLMRTFFSVCVPLFMILTGYLMSKKTLSRKYYSGISKTLIVFVLATIACMLYKAEHENAVFTFKAFILGTLDFTGANYSWYVEMYIGLFLIIPFLNLAYNNLKNKRHKQVLVLTMIVLTVLPTVFNIFNFENAGWWIDPKSSDTFSKLIPSWWMGFYPVTYYFTGCYIREYGIKLKTRTLIVLFVLAIFLFGSFNFYRSHGTTFKSGTYVYWYGFEPYVLSVFLFVLLSRIKTEKFAVGVKFTLWKLSDLALGIYLMSYVFDSLVYPVLNEKVPVMTDRLPYYFITVPLVFILSALSSVIINIITHFILVIYKRIVEIIKTERINANKTIWQDYLFFALMIGALIFSFWKCRYGFAGDDEAFYLTIPQRLIDGDALIKDEWHLSQLSGIFMMPFVWLYTTIMQSTDGIILAARIFYIIFHATVSVIVYTRLRKYGYISVFASVLYFIFSPYNIMAMSYNTMGLDFITLTGAIIGTADYKKKLPVILSGITFAASVLCCPYLAVVYVLFGICVIVHQIIKNKDIKFVLKSELFSIKTFLFFTLGVSALAVVFLIFTLTRVSVNEIIEYLPYLMTDPEHPQIAFTTRFTSYFKSIFDFNEYFKYAFYSYVVMLVIMVADRKRKLHRSVYLIATTAIVIFCYVIILPNLTYTYYNAIMFPIIFIGITSYILCDNKPRELFASLFILGILYSIAICFSSNQYFYIIAVALTSANLASYVFLGQLIKEMRTSPDNIEYAVWVKRGSFAFVAFMIILQASFQINVKAKHCFWEMGGMQSLTSQISSGPAKGIYTTDQNCNSYEKIRYDLSYYNGVQSDKILHLTRRTWCYLATDNLPYGTLSAWISGEKPSSIDRLKVYYSVNPENTPKYIYIPKESDWDLTNIYGDAQAYGYTVTENDISYKLEKVN